MQIVIEISEEDKKELDDSIKGKGFSYFEKAKLIRKILFAVFHGKILPKGHGDLIDISNIDNDKIEKDNPVIYLTVNGEYIEAVSLDYLNGLPIIIEADRSEEE